MITIDRLDFYVRDGVMFNMKGEICGYIYGKKPSQQGQENPLYASYEFVDLMDMDIQCTINPKRVELMVTKASNLNSTNTGIVPSNFSTSIVADEGPRNIDMDI